MTNIMQVISENIGLIITFLSFAITLTAFLFALWLYLRDKRNKIINNLAKQVMGYYSEEQEAMTEIARLTNKSCATIQKQLRTQAMSNGNNSYNVYPKMTAKETEKYLCKYI